jgi:CubicO group peptidase (beta-lactamase class C family)
MTRPVTERMRTAWRSCGLLLGQLAILGSTLAANPVHDPGDELEALLAQQRLSGVVWATVAGEQVSVGARGLANAAHGVALRADHRVHTGSLAKTVLALALLRRVSQGALDLDAPVQSLLPTLPIDNPWAASHPLRLRHLLDMTSGLDDFRLWHMFSRVGSDLPLAEVFGRDLRVLRLRTPPGTRFSYTNMGFTLAAMALESSTGERYESWVQREVLLPLGLHDSRLSYATAIGTDAQEQLAWGHVEGPQPVVTPPVAIRPAAQFITTAADMAKLARFLMSDGTLQGSPFVAEPLLRAMGRASSTDAARAGLQTGYALGLFTRDRHGAVGLCHGGSVAGFRAMLCVYPAQQRAFFLALNTDDENARYAQFDERLVQALGVATAAVAALPQPAPEADSAWAGRYVPAPGRWSQTTLLDRLFGFWTLSWREGQAQLREGLGATRALVRVGPGLYRQADRQQATLALLGSAQDPLLGGGYLTLRRISALDFWGPWASAAGGLLGLLWWLLVPPPRRLRHGSPAKLRQQPAWWGLLLLLAAAGALALQPWQRLGELTPTTTLWAGATLLLPVALLAQAALWFRQRNAAPGRARRVIDPVALFLALQGCGLLALFGLWPIFTWTL